MGISVSLVHHSPWGEWGGFLGKEAVPCPRPSAQDTRFCFHNFSWPVLIFNAETRHDPALPDWNPACPRRATGESDLIDVLAPPAPFWGAAALGVLGERLGGPAPVRIVPALCPQTFIASHITRPCPGAGTQPPRLHHPRFPGASRLGWARFGVCPSPPPPPSLSARGRGFIHKSCPAGRGAPGRCRRRGGRGGGGSGAGPGEPPAGGAGRRGRRKRPLA